jgi:quercetin dioxygenase-like cupin family protein
MNRFLMLAVVLLVAVACAPAPVGEFDFADGVVQHAVPVADIPWRSCPENLPPGCEIAVLEGNPRAPGLFTVRFRMTGDFRLPAHTHPKDERVTVLSGRMAVGFGVDATRADAREFGPGDYYVNARDAVHVVWAEDDAVVQITGFGPWEANFLRSD